MKIVVTGAQGFLGKAVCNKLKLLQYDITEINGKQDFDLTIQRNVDYMFNYHKPDILIHLAARVGGIGANQNSPGLFMYENLEMGINIIDTSRKYGKLKKLVMIGTVCSYPKFTPIPFEEHDLWNGYPEETNAPYGIAKKAIMELAIAYHKQYGLNVTNLIPTNMYGPEDNFDPKSSHVIPAIILKIAKAIKNNEDSVTIWGSGSATREFLHVKDCASAIVDSMLCVTGPEPINLGTGIETSVEQIADQIRFEMAYGGSILWDKNKPDGQPRRVLDVSKAFKILDFKSKISLETGVHELINWFEIQNEKGIFDDYFNYI